jgi:hypothetical protein
MEETLFRSIKVRSYDGNDEADMPVPGSSTVEQVIPGWLERLQLFSRDADGNPLAWTLQDARGNMIPSGVRVEELDVTQEYTLAPDLTPA